MVRCVLCGKELKTERGYSVHLSRSHKISGHHGRFSLAFIYEFFSLLEKKRWKKAETYLENLKMDNVDDWISGYIHALNGMVTGLSMSHSVPRPYILYLKDFNDKKIKSLKNGFASFSKKLASKNDFDAGYFRAWKDFTEYVIRLRH